MRRHGVLLLSVTMVFFCATALATATSKPTTAPATSGAASKPTSRPWTNEPPGFKALTDYSCEHLPRELNDKTPAPGEPKGWSKFAKETVTIVDDPAAPLSPPKVIQYLYRKGHKAGYGTGSLWFPLNHNEIYIGMYMKVSPNWQQTDAGLTKLFYIFQRKGDNRQAFFPCLRGMTGEVLHIGISNEAGDNGKWWNQNKANIPIELDRWHKIEWYFKKASAEGADDGVVKWWIDGQLAAEHTGAKTRAQNFSEFQWNAVWGGSGPTPKLHDDYLRWDHVYISGK